MYHRSTTINTNIQVPFHILIIKLVISPFELNNHYTNNKLLSLSLSLSLKPTYSGSWPKKRKAQRPVNIDLTMLQLFFAVAFSAVPLTLYVPPIRSLNLFVETMEDVLRQTSLYTVRAYPRIRLVFSRFFRNLFSLSR